jgi:hypothetical protein
MRQLGWGALDPQTLHNNVAIMPYSVFDMDFVLHQAALGSAK